MLARRLRVLVAFLGVSGVALASTGPNVWLDVPFVRQEKDGCGAAVIAMVMQYWQRQQGQAPGSSADPVKIQRALYSQKEHGIYASDLERYLSEHGYQTFAFRGEWTDLESNLAKGRPLLAALKPGRADALHYVVIAGIDPQEGTILMNDPAQRKLLKQDRSDFEKQWKAAGNWTLLAVPK